MRTKIKNLILIFLSLATVVSLTIVASAVEPQYSDTSSISIRLSFIGTTANCSVRVYGADSTTSISNVNITLSDSNGTVVGEWSNLSSIGRSFSYFDTVSDLNKGEQYTLTATAYVNGNNSSEFISNSKSQICPK